MTKGIVKWFDMSKGFGFIEATNGKDVFVHFDQVLTVGYEPLIQGQEVEFVLGEEVKGLRALDVRVVGNPRGTFKPQKSAKRTSKAQDSNTKARATTTNAQTPKPKVKKVKARKKPDMPLPSTRAKAIKHSRVRLIG